MKLTAPEKKWLSDVQKLLDACPSKRLGFYTIGDPDVAVYDRSMEKKILALMDSNAASDYPVAVEQLDAGLGELRFPANVHSVSG